MFAEKTKDGRVTVAEGTFERMDAEDNWADLVVIAQAGRLRPLIWELRFEHRCRHSIGARTMKKLPRSLLESSNLRARWLLSGTWRTGRWYISRAISPM